MKAYGAAWSLAPVDSSSVLTGYESQELRLISFTLLGKAIMPPGHHGVLELEQKLPEQ